MVSRDFFEPELVRVFFEVCGSSKVTGWRASSALAVFCGWRTHDTLFFSSPGFALSSNRSVHVWN